MLQLSVKDMWPYLQIQSNAFTCRAVRAVLSIQVVDLLISRDHQGANFLMIAAKLGNEDVFGRAFDFAQRKLDEKQVGKCPSDLQACLVDFPV